MRALQRILECPGGAERQSTFYPRRHSGLCKVTMRIPYTLQLTEDGCAERRGF
jgi:hypothetical protein